MRCAPSPSPESHLLSLVTLVVPDYDAAIAHYVDGFGFTLVEDTPQSPTKRWVVVRPPGEGGAALLLARAATPFQATRVGSQTGDRVAFFLETDDFARDAARFAAAGATFLEAPRHEPYGTVAQFRDRFGNRWDLIQRTTSAPAAR